MQVKDIMSQQMTSCTPDAAIEEVAALMVKCDCGAIPVIDPQTQKAVGVITDRDIVVRAVAEGHNPFGMKVDEVMTMPVTAVGPETSLEDCLARMEASQIRRMLVVDGDGKLCGIVSQADIARAAPEHQTAELVKDVSKPSEQASKVQ
ncbi:MAG TPA: CBS domain-containing protein [Tepidisphaeraceae bacterium]|jgi:CBS domain-containing protein